MVLATTTYKALYERVTKRVAVNRAHIQPYTRIELVAARCTSARCCLLLLTAGLLITSLMASLIALLIAPLIPLLMTCL